MEMSMQKDDTILTMFDNQFWSLSLGYQCADTATLGLNYPLIRFSFHLAP
jgi:hypothetical protein